MTQNILKNKKKSAICIVVDTKGSSPRKIGAKMTVFSNGSILGTIGGGNLEKSVINNAIEQINRNEAKLFKHDLLHQHNMCCGGQVYIYIEPVMEKKNLFIFGAGHTAKALAELAIKLDFEIYIIDNRKDYINAINIEGINKMNVPYTSALPALPFDENSFITIMTYEHSYDRDILAHCLKQNFAYLGMIGSKRKVELTKKMFLESKIATIEQLNKVDMPMGININAEGPEEIAISIISILIAIKNKSLNNE